MAITAAHITDGSDTTSASTYVTASVSPGSNLLLLLTVVATPVSSDNTPPTSVTGLGLTWVRLNTNGEYGGVGAGRCIWVYRALGAVTAGTVSINFPANQDSVVWSLDAYDGVDTSGTNGSGAVVQTVASLPADTQSSHLVTLAAFGSVNNFAHGAFSHAALEGWTPGSGFTSLVQTTVATPHLSLFTEYKQNDTAVSGSFASASTRGGVAVEVKAAPAIAATLDYATFPKPKMTAGGVYTP